MSDFLPVRKEMPKMVGEYANALAADKGVGGDQAKVVRAKYATDAEFQRYADAMDRLKRYFAVDQEAAR